MVAFTLLTQPTSVHITAQISDVAVFIDSALLREADSA